MSALKILLITLGVIMGLSTLGNLITGNVWPLGIVFTLIFLGIGFSINKKEDK
jgi:hypothetical protein